MAGFGANLAGKGQDIESSFVTLLCALLIVNRWQINLELWFLWTANSVGGLATAH